MAWLLLICAGFLEIVWATALARSDGFTRLWPTFVGVSGAAASFALLAIALRDLPVGTAYAHASSSSTSVGAPARLTPRELPARRRHRPPIRPQPRRLGSAPC